MESQPENLNYHLKNIYSAKLIIDSKRILKSEKIDPSSQSKVDEIEGKVVHAVKFHYFYSNGMHFYQRRGHQPTITPKDKGL